MATVLRVEHPNLSGGQVTFSDDELLSLIMYHQQIVVEQQSQTNNLQAVYVGTPRFDFEMSYNVYFQTTLQKLEAIRNLRDTFTIFPFLLEEPLSEFDVIWPQEPTIREQWVLGRRQAHWDHPVVWKEQRLVPCPPFALS
jgi:hypothetical protein